MYYILSVYLWASSFLNRRRAPFAIYDVSHAWFVICDESFMWRESFVYDVSRSWQRRAPFAIYDVSRSWLMLIDRVDKYIFTCTYRQSRQIQRCEVSSFVKTWCESFVTCDVCHSWQMTRVVRDMWRVSFVTCDARHSRCGIQTE